ncbi:hypothetical protein EU99_1075 [Prochlorococcus marinus str. MIT 9321]|uniref:TVP38/TMEM64 family membrane protein n=1 Tax=Prochlorococcus marinus str. MIT 9401 TaxID=167551 RepID=A0A0A2B3V9_PROMR|nr:hypothetical protein EU99_1075 [Prochlorococcus marinus str. MIT 9321]KGG04632.1 hypothetical protein EV00_1664 [Prochlorococcus marinus str. MIT 9322]KGG07314.1 hypothetical protein EV01_1651 [Prochlorococcus marinus str. MIT 9401]
MSRKNLNFKSTIFKIFIFYIVIYLFALFLRYSNGFDNLIIEIEYKYLASINIFSILLGLPLSIVFDLILIKFFGLKYIIFFAPILTILGMAQIIFLRKTNLRFSKNISLIKNIRNHRLKYIFENITFKPIFILIIRTFPIIPFSLGSYFIASSTIKKRLIMIYSLFGSYFYYFSLFLIIRSA